MKEEENKNEAEKDINPCCDSSDIVMRFSASVGLGHGAHFSAFCRNCSAEGPADFTVTTLKSGECSWGEG